MKYRWTQLQAKEDLGAAGTHIVDISSPEIISKLMIRMEGIVPGTRTMIEHPATMISKIEVVDGSDVLYSLTGLQAQAVDILDSGRQNLGSGSIVSAWGLIAIYNLNFGRWLWDERLALDPTRFRNPQIKITWDENAPIAGIATSYLSIVSETFDEKTVSPEGFLMNKEIFSYTPVANEVKRVVLPRDYPIRRVFLQARAIDLWLGGIVAHMELEEDERRHVIFALENEEFEYIQKQVCPVYEEHFVADLDDTTGKTIWHCPTQGLSPNGALYAASAVLDAIPFGPDNDYKCGDNIGYQAFSIRGHVPHGVLVLPTGQQDDPEDWWQAQEHKTTFRITNGASIAGTETFRVMTQQFRRY